METAQTEIPGTRQKTPGRKTNDGTTEVVKFDSIKKGCAEMMKAFKKAETAKDDFNAIVSGVAERSGCNAVTLKRLVKSSAKGNFADVRNKIDQESSIFEMVGEIQGGKASGE